MSAQRPRDCLAAVSAQRGGEVLRSRIGSREVRSGAVRTSEGIGEASHRGDLAPWIPPRRCGIDPRYGATSRVQTRARVATKGHRRNRHRRPGPPGSRRGSRRPDRSRKPSCHISGRIRNGPIKRRPLEPRTDRIDGRLLRATVGRRDHDGTVTRNARDAEIEVRRARSQSSTVRAGQLRLGSTARRSKRRPPGPPTLEGPGSQSLYLRGSRRRGRDLNPRPDFRRVRDFQSRSLGHSDTSPRLAHGIRVSGPPRRALR